MFDQDESQRPDPGTHLCELGEIADGGAKGFQWGEGASAYRIFLVRQKDRVWAYIDTCPHLGTPLAYLPNRFLSEDGSQIVCSTHGARFRPQDGYCVSGPCEGKSLRPFPIEMADDKISVGQKI